jgi:large subunit ribosomal protein L24e
MVVKRQCSFCADEIEPGTGMMFVKRDGTVFYFCSSSCRKQQLHLGRVGHRLKWTRAHAIKRAAEQSGPGGSRPSSAADKSRPKSPGPGSVKRTTPTRAEKSAGPPPTPAAPAAPAATAEGEAKSTPVKSAKPKRPATKPASGGKKPSA